MFVHLPVSESIEADIDVKCVFLWLSTLFFERGSLTELGTCCFSQMSWPASLVPAYIPLLPPVLGL